MNYVDYVDYNYNDEDESDNVLAGSSSQTSRGHERDIKSLPHADSKNIQVEFMDDSSSDGAEFDLVAWNKACLDLYPIDKYPTVYVSCYTLLCDAGRRYEYLRRGARLHWDVTDIYIITQSTNRTFFVLSVVSRFHR